MIASLDPVFKAVITSSFRGSNDRLKAFETKQPPASSLYAESSFDFNENLPEYDNVDEENPDGGGANSWLSQHHIDGGADSWLSQHHNDGGGDFEEDEAISGEAEGAYMSIVHASTLLEGDDA